MKRALISLTIITTLFTSIYSLGGTVPAGLPSHFAFGAIDKADSYATSSPHFWKDGQYSPCSGWDYSYNYLTPGWVSWVSGGGWARQEIQYWEGKNQQMVFTFYYTPYARSNYQNATWMTTYLNDFKTLMQVINTNATKKVIVHLEPDLLGFWMKDDGRTPTTSNVVQVGGSNFDEVCDGVSINNLPNTIQGWSEALYRIRNQYAPTKALLAHHYTHWMTNVDVFAASQNQSTVNTHVDSAINFMTQMENGKPFDLFFLDPSDRDADWFYIKQGNATRWTGSSRTFTENRSWGKISYIVNRLSTGLGRRGMFWQIPVGNTYFKTCNNSNNHFRDNHAQEFLPSTSANGASGTPGDAYSSSSTTTGPGYWAQVGIIGVLFGEGGYDQYISPNDMTHLRDWPGDGITNPTSNTAGPSGFNTWGLANSTVADNDGGYVRLAVKRYCETGKYQLGGTPNTPTRTNTPAPPTATFTRTATRTNTPVPPTATFTRTATRTNTPVPPTATFTRTATSTNTPVPPTLTFTRTATRTNTLVPPTSTFTRTATRTNSPTPPATASPTGTPIPPTATFTATRTNTAVPPTFTSTATRTNTQVINSPTASNTPVPPTATFTRTATSTNTVVVPTPTRTATRTVTMTATNVPPNSTFTFTATITNTITIPTATPTRTATMTNTAVFTFSTTPTVTMTHTAVPPDSTATSTPSITNTVIIPTATPSRTATPTSTATSTRTNVPPAQTFTATVTRTAVVTPTPTAGRVLEIPAEKPVIAFPNPYTQGDGEIRISFSITKDADSINIRMYTVSGRLVRSFDLGSTGRGEVSVSIDKSKLSGLAKGVYFYKIRARAGSEKAESLPQKLLILN